MYKKHRQDGGWWNPLPEGRWGGWWRQRNCEMIHSHSYLSASCRSARSGRWRPLCGYTCRRGVGGEQSSFRRLLVLQYILNQAWTFCLVFACFCLLEIESRDSFICARATQILAAASIRERRLFRSAHLEVRQQFESSVWSSEYGSEKCLLLSNVRWQILTQNWLCNFEIAKICKSHRT